MPHRHYENHNIRNASTLMVIRGGVLLIPLFSVAMFQSDFGFKNKKVPKSANRCNFKLVEISSL